MHAQTLAKWRHGHDFSVHNPAGEKNTFYVLILTAVTMIVEVVAGSVYGSMALLADGWHMGTHVAAFMIALFAYRYARAHANDPAYAFGTGKVNVLGGFASAVALAVVALVMAVESLHRLVDPQTIRFNEAIAVAFIGLAVNVASMFILKEHHHHHGDDHDHHHHHHHDHNLKAAYMHVLADAMTSLFAIGALLLGKYFGLGWMDPVMGIVGAVIITKWSAGLMKNTAPVLLDASMDAAELEAIRRAVEADADNRISDLHVWRVGPNHFAAVISLVTHTPCPVEHYKSLLEPFTKLSHVSVEIIKCEDEECMPSDISR